MKNDSRTENILKAACLFLGFGGAALAMIGYYYTTKPMTSLLIGGIMSCVGLFCGFAEIAIHANRSVSLPLPPTTDSSSRERFTVEISPETTKALKELGKWLGGKEDEGTVLASALALLMTVKECVEAGGTLCFRDKDGVVQDVNLKYSGKK